MKSKKTIITIIAILFCIVVFSSCSTEYTYEDYYDGISKEDSSVDERELTTMEENTTAEETTKKPKESSTVSKHPIGIPKGYSLLQAFFLKCTKEKTDKDLEELAEKCGLYTSRYEYSEYHITLQFSKHPIENTIIYHDEYDYDYIDISYDLNDDNVYKIFKLDYYLANGSSVFYEPDGMIYRNGKVEDDTYYIVNQNWDVRYYSAKEAMDKAKE